MLSKNFYRIAAVLVTAAVLLTATFYVASVAFKKQYVWIDLNKVYNEFKLKKDLEVKFKSAESLRMRITDSLELDLKIAAKQFNYSKNQDQQYQFELKKEELFLKKKQFEEDNEQLRRDYNGQVLTQINQYVKEYAKAKGISLVLGAEGTGTLMYAEEATEATNDVLIFINNKYNGI